jgi:hypothetical protein
MLYLLLYPRRPVFQGLKVPKLLAILLETIYAIAFVLFPALTFLSCRFLVALQIWGSLLISYVVLGVFFPSRGFR